MPIRALDTLLALKVLSLVEGLNASDRRVAATLIEHYNRRSERCDPGLESIGKLLGISARTVIRANRRIVAAGLFKKIRHGGPGNRNRYEPDWERFAQLEEAWNRKRRSTSAPTALSPAMRQPRHLQGDKAVTQTCNSNNLPEKTCSKWSSEEGKRQGRFIERHLTAAAGKRATSAACDEAERRWTSQVQQRFVALPITYAEIIQAITEDMRSAATEAELACRGAGLRYILNQLKLGDGR